VGVVRCVRGVNAPPRSVRARTPAGGRYRLYGFTYIKQPVPLYGDFQPEPGDYSLSPKLRVEIFTY
jgi:hypothetical protein